MILNINGEKPPLFYVPTSIVVKLNAGMAMRGRRDALVNRSIPLAMRPTNSPIGRIFYLIGKK